MRLLLSAFLAESIRITPIVIYLLGMNGKGVRPDTAAANRMHTPTVRCPMKRECHLVLFDAKTAMRLKAYRLCENRISVSPKQNLLLHHAAPVPMTPTSFQLFRSFVNNKVLLEYGGRED